MYQTVHRVWKNCIKMVISSGSNLQTNDVLLESAKDVLMELSSPTTWIDHFMRRLSQQRDTSSDSDSETPMLYAMQSDNLPSPSESAELDYNKGGDDTGNAKDPQDIDPELLPQEESPPPLWRSACQRRSPSTHTLSSVWSWDQRGL